MRFNHGTVRKAILLLPLLCLLAALARTEASDPYPYVPGQVIVRLKPSAPTGLLGALGYRGASDPSGPDFELVRTRSGQSVEDAIAELQGRSDVLSVQPNYIYRGLTVIPNDTQFAAQYHLAIIGAPEAWEYARGSASETIAIIDSGADTTHIDLGARLVAAPSIDIIDGNGDVSDTPSGSGHGTRVAGTAASVTNNGIHCAGVDWNSNILPIRVLTGADAIGTSADIDSGIRRAIALKATVINLSLGFDNSTSDPLIEARLLEAYNAGIITVASSGNSGGQYVIYPASSSYAIAVGSSTSTDARSAFSSYGTYPGMTGVDVVAPGSAIVTLSLNGAVVSTSGTSFSSPIVAAAAAMVKGIRPGITPAQFLKLLRSTAKDIETAGFDDFTGAGRLDLARLLRVAAANPRPGDSIPHGDTRSASWASSGGRQGAGVLTLSAQDSHAGYYQRHAAARGSIQFYWRPDSVQPSDTAFVLTQRGNTAHAKGNLDLILRSDMRLELRMQDSGSVVSPAALHGGQWYHVAITYGDSGLMLAVNGETTGSLLVIPGGPPLGDSIYLGAPFALGGAQSARGRYSQLAFGSTESRLYPSALQVVIESQPSATSEVGTAKVSWKAWQTETNTVTIDVYADTDGSGFNGTLIASGLTDDQTESVSLATLTIGTSYRLYVVATDATTSGNAQPERAYAYAAASITPSVPATVTVSGSAGSPGGGGGGCAVGRALGPLATAVVLRSWRDAFLESAPGRMLCAAWYALLA